MENIRARAQLHMMLWLCISIINSKKFFITEYVLRVVPSHLRFMNWICGRLNISIALTDFWHFIFACPVHDRYAHRKKAFAQSHAVPPALCWRSHEPMTLSVLLTLKTIHHPLITQPKIPTVKDECDCHPQQRAGSVRQCHGSKECRAVPCQWKKNCNIGTVTSMSQSRPQVINLGPLFATDNHDADGIMTKSRMQAVSVFTLRS